MKRLIASILAAAMLIALAACGSNSENDVQTDAESENQTQEEQGLKVESGEDVVIEGEMLEITPVEPEDKAEADKPANTESSKGNNNNNNNKNNSSNKAETSGGGLKVESEGGLKVESGEGIVIEGEALEITPVEPEKKPEASAPAASTAGTALQAAFKAQVSANSSISAQALADALLGNSVIKFSGGTVPVEPGLLTGFDNAEIKGFSEGVMFAPMIGTIPFVGYVFTLESGTDAAGFVSTLKANANPRWNICTTAEETIVDSVGNKVFFVMCPKDMSE